ncbi:hypothetical protein HDV00_009952 [Rhizophlyctis rosea]|nr:hypothetical protein HDV00_009952 [Rhizophlyctis rosea]
MPSPPPTLLALPPELLTRIFILSTSANLPLANRTFHTLSQPLRTRAQWLLAMYGPFIAPIKCFDWNFVQGGNSCTCRKAAKQEEKRVEKEEEESVKGVGKIRWVGRVLRSAAMREDAHAGEEEEESAGGENVVHEIASRKEGTVRLFMLGKRGSRSSEHNLSQCPFEDAQLRLFRILATLRCSPSVHFTAGDDFALRWAAGRGHIQLAEFLLKSGANPEALVPIEKEGWWRRRVRVPVYGYVPVWPNMDQGGVVHNAVVQQGLGAVVLGVPAVISTTVAAQGMPAAPPPIHAATPPIANATQPQPLPLPLSAPAAPTAQAQPIPQPPQPNTRRLLPRRLIRITPPPLPVPLICQAVSANHISLVELLLRWNQPVIPPRSDSNPSAITTLPPSLPNRHPLPPISPEILTKALTTALLSSRHRIAKLLLDAGAHSTPNLVHTIISKAQTRRMALGPRSVFGRHLRVAILALPTADFIRLRAGLLRSCAEIGVAAGIEACVLRGASGVYDPSTPQPIAVPPNAPTLGGDGDAWSGLPLYASVYNGNIAATKALLYSARVSTSYFDWKQKTFCVALMAIEVLAMLMFGVLVAVWAVGIVQSVTGAAVFGEDPGSAPPVDGGTMVDTKYISTDNAVITVAELTGLAIPSLIALGIMYRLVPFHAMLAAYLEIVREDRRRRQVTAGEEAARNV